MVDTLDAETLAKWHAVAIIDGWGEDNERAARISAAIHNAIMIASAKSGGKVDESDFKDSDDFIPRFAFEKKPIVVQTPEQIMAAAKRSAGIK